MYKRQKINSHIIRFTTFSFFAQLNKSLNVIILLSFSLKTFCFQLDFTPLATPKKYNSTYIQQRKEEDPSTKKEKTKRKKKEEEL